MCKFFLISIDIPNEPKQKGSFFKKRREEYVKILHENFEVGDGSHVKQSVVLTTLNLSEYHKVKATNAIKQAFPGTVVNSTYQEQRSYFAIVITNNSTILGTMSILDGLSKTFNLPNEGKGGEYVPYDSTAGMFDVSCARAHYELLLSQKVYEKKSRETVAEMKANEKAVDGGLEVVQEESEDEDTELLKPS